MSDWSAAFKVMHVVIWALFTACIQINAAVTLDLMLLSKTKKKVSRICSVEYLVCNFLPIQPEDDDDIKSGLKNYTNQQSYPESCRKNEKYVESKVVVT